MKARKAYEVEYPALYADEKNCEQQRAHLLGHPPLLLLLPSALAAWSLTHSLPPLRLSLPPI